jgi:mannonate dehydratase
MIESWRWFGPLDRIELSEVAQTGARGIVTALHELPYGEVWSPEDIEARKALIAKAPGDLSWVVTESLPIHEDIKRGTGDLSKLFANYRQSLANLSAAGVKTVCYNFMPLLDWTRTRLDAPLATGGSALRYDAVEMAVFDVFMLERPGAAADFPADVVADAERWHKSLGEKEKDRLLHAIMSGLPGAYDRYDIVGLRAALEPWQGVAADDLRSNFARFLQEIVPAAEDLGIRLCVHPDDPPRPLLGLPRIVSTEADIAFIMDAVDSVANGLTLCSGSLGANPANDVPAIAARFADRIHFAHLRNVAKEPNGSFQEAAHLEGDTDMAAVVAVLLQEEARRREVGREDADIPMRPDHGHEVLSDVGRGTHPGYPLIGRMRGLAELRGVIAGVRHGARSLV